MKPRQVPFFLYWRVENVQFWINSIGHLGWLSCILNFPRFHKNVNSLELWKYISENSSPKGSFWGNKRKSEFSSLSADSRYLLAVALKNRTTRSYTWSQSEPQIFSRLDYWSISNSFVDNVCSVHMMPSINTDHSAILIEFLGVNAKAIGNSIAPYWVTILTWKINSSIPKGYRKERTILKTCDNYGTGWNTTSRNIPENIQWISVWKRIKA